LPPCLGAGTSAGCQDRCVCRSRHDTQKSDAIASDDGRVVQASRSPPNNKPLATGAAVVTAMTPEGFYAEMMDDMMGSMLQPMLAGATCSAEEALKLQVGLQPDNQPELSDAQRARFVALLDPVAKERAGAVMRA
jgi:hypothetical protein